MALAENFLWGAAGAAVQNEGLEGRGLNVADMMTPGGSGYAFPVSRGDKEALRFPVCRR